MNDGFDWLVRGVLIGIGATAAMDLYAMIVKRVFDVPASNWGFVGRWIGHFPRGKFAHDNMKAAPPIRAELAIGWITHYVVGAAYGVLLLAICGIEWSRHPTLWPAMLVGVSMLIAPFFIMQPAMGAGIASSKAPNPTAARLRSVANHSIFGVGLYATAWLLS